MNGSSTLLLSTGVLARDMLVFGITGLYETLVPVEYQYKATPYIHKVQTSVKEVSDRIAPVLHYTWVKIHHGVSRMYKEFNAQSKRALDPLVAGFSSRYPISGGLIGPSLLDRILLALWMLWVLRTIYRVLGRLFHRERSRSPPKAVNRADPHPVSPVPTSPSGALTARKRIVISK